MPLPSTTPGSTPWDPGSDIARPPTYYKGEHATRIDDILVSASLTRAKCLGGYTTMGKEHPMNGSDHRAVIMHCDINSFIGMGRPRPPKDDVKQRIRAMTSALEKGEPSKIAAAYIAELVSLQKGNTGATAVHQDNSAGKRAKDATSAYKKAKDGEGDLAKATNDLSNALDKLLVAAADRATWAQRKSSHRNAAWSPKMATHSAALNFLRQSGRWSLALLRQKLAQLPLEQQQLMPTPWDDARALLAPKAAKDDWASVAEEKIMELRRELSAATKEYDRARINHRTAVREKARRLGETGQIFRELLGAKRANGKEILTIGEGADTEFLYKAESVHRAFSGHFNKHFGAGRKKWYRRARVHPLFRMDHIGTEYRNQVLAGTADSSSLPKDLQGSLEALQTKTVGGVRLTPALYTGIVTDDEGKIIPISKEEWSWHWKDVAKAKAPGDSGVTTDMLRLAPADVLESYREIANEALNGGCVPDSWKREVMFPTEKIAGRIWIEKHRPIMLIEACRKACTGILIKRIRKVWDANTAISPCNTGFARDVSTVEPIMKLRMCIDQALRKEKPLFLNGEDLSKAFDSPERAIKDIALRRLGVPESVVDFLAALDEGNQVHIITSYGVTYDTTGLEKGFEAQ